MREPTPAELEELFAPRNFEQGGPANYDTASNHIFDSWKDADLFRAIDAPENGEPGEAQDREVQEYVDELKRRGEARAAQAAREEHLRAKYQI